MAASTWSLITEVVVVFGSCSLTRCQLAPTPQQRSQLDSSRFAPTIIVLSPSCSLLPLQHHVTAPISSRAADGKIFFEK